MSDSITIELNGAPMTVPIGTTITQLLVDLEIDPLRIAVERNREVVRRTRHPSVTVEAGDMIEIVTFVGGG